MSFKDRGMSVRAVLALAAMLAALALSACGDDDDGGDAKAPSADSSQAVDGGNANASDGGSGDPGGADGAGGNASAGDTEPVNLTQARLTPAERQRLQEQAPTPRPYKEVFDRGFPKEKATLLRIYRQMQNEFYGGRFLDFCRHFTDSLVALPNLESGDPEERFKECAGIVSRVAKRLAQGKLDWRPNRIQWVRVYNDPGRDPYGGVTVIGGFKQVRVGFVKENGRWRPDFAIPGDLAAIGAS
ncbi:MAG TPA: hypothetical protein VEX36_08040 [Thermoleophilaceae bacterium]|nr:hypothetical protein [Thermoleophilaceae bacterium]